jgi:hypothetical protein
MSYDSEFTFRAGLYIGGHQFVQLPFLSLPYMQIRHSQVKCNAPIKDQILAPSVQNSNNSNLEFFLSFFLSFFLPKLLKVAKADSKKIS